MDDSYKEVYFNEYCKSCANKKYQEHEEPCYSCLNEPVNLYSHKPAKYEKTTIKEKPPKVDPPSQEE